MMSNASFVPENIDLTDIFIGRERELNQFRMHLGKWRSDISRHFDPPPPLPPSPTNRIQGLLVWLHGRGGFGKSMLLTRYRQIALQRQYGLHVGDIIDWEVAAAEHQRAIFTIEAREEIDAYRYFHLLASTLASALHRSLRDFNAYREAEQTADRARKQAYDVLHQLQDEEGFSWLRGISVARDTLLALLSMLNPSFGVLLTNDFLLKRIRSVFDAGTGVGIEHVRRLSQQFQARLGNGLNNYLDAPLELGLALGRDLRRFAERQPLLIFFDTYEVIDEGDWLLRICMGVAGQRVGWVISGRDNLWAGMSLIIRGFGPETGYKDIAVADHSFVVDFSEDGGGNLTPDEINTYFHEICQRAKLPLPSGNAFANSHRIMEITWGIPLALKIVASLYLERRDLTLITEDTEHRHEIIEQMVHRYLIHARDTPADRTCLYALALLRHAEDPSVLATALSLPPGHEVQTELRRLHRRYSFVFTRSGQSHMHQEVRHFLRLWLLIHYKQPEIQSVIQRLCEILHKQLELQDRQHRSTNLRERLTDNEWVQRYLDLTELEFWHDPARGVMLFLPFMCAASIYQRERNGEVGRQGQFFVKHIPEPFRSYWEWAESCLVPLTNLSPLSDERHKLRELARLAGQRTITFSLPFLRNFSQELEAALWWRLGEAYSSSDMREAAYWYHKAKQRLPHEEALRHAYENARRGQKTQIILPLTFDEHLERGYEYLASEEPQQALEHFNEALKREKTNVQAYSGRGDAHLLLGGPKQAIVDFDRAHSLQPDNVKVLKKRAETHEQLKNVSNAIRDLRKVTQLNPNDTLSREKLDKLQRSLEEPEKHTIFSWRLPYILIRQRKKHPFTWYTITVFIMLIPVVLSVFFIRLNSSQQKPPSCTLKNQSLSPLSSPLQQSSSSAVSQLKPLSVSAKGTQGVAWSPDGKTIASSDDQYVYILNPQGVLLAQCPGSERPDVWRVEWSPDSKYIAAGGDDGTLRIWSWEDGKGIFAETQAKQVRGVAWSPDGRFIASADGQGDIRIWNMTDPHHVVEAPAINSDPGNGAAYGLAWSHTGKYLAIPYGKGMIDIWDVTTHKRIHSYQKHHRLTAYFVCWSPDDNTIASVGTDKTLQVWNMQKGQPAFLTGQDLRDPVYGVAWSTDGHYIAATSRDGVHVYDAHDGHLVALSPGKDIMYGVAWASHSKRLVTDGPNQHVSVWQVP